MNIKGKVIQVLPLQSGVSKNGEWKKQDIVVETDGQYPKKVCITIWGDKAETVLNGSTVDVSIDIESREYNGRWYTEVKAWKIDQVAGQAQQPSQAAPSNTSSDDTNDLPF